MMKDDALEQGAQQLRPLIPQRTTGLAAIAFAASFDIELRRQPPGLVRFVTYKDGTGVSMVDATNDVVHIESTGEGNSLLSSSHESPMRIAGVGKSGEFQELFLWGRFAVVRIMGVISPVIDRDDPETSGVLHGSLPSLQIGQPYLDGQFTRILSCEMIDQRKGHTERPRRVGINPFAKILPLLRPHIC